MELNWCEIKWKDAEVLVRLQTTCKRTRPSMAMNVEFVVLMSHTDEFSAFQGIPF